MHRTEPARLSKHPDRKRGRYPLAIFCLLYILTTPAAADSNQDTEQKLDQLKQQIGKLQGWLGSAKNERSQMQRALRKSELEIAQVAGRINTVIHDINRTRDKLKTLQQEQKQLFKARDQQAQYLARQIRMSYRIGRQEYLKVLLNQERPERIARTLRYYDYFNRARTEQIEAYGNTITRLQQNEKDTAREREALQRSKDQLQKKQADLNKNKIVRRNILLKLNSNIENRSQELKQLLSDQQRLEELLNAVEQAVADLELPEAATPIARLKGSLPWPVKGKIVRHFGLRDKQSITRWNGVLISATEGNDVRAIHHGRVVFADWLRGFGLLTIVDHGAGYMSLYGHNQTLYKEVGDWVNPNETIASVGNSGGQQQAGLYFEIRRNGNPENPKNWVQRK